MSKSCIISTVKSKIKGNATSFIEKENEIFIPTSKKFSLVQTRVIAQDKVNKINKEYLSEKFGAVVSLNTSYTDGTGINIHPSQRLVEAYEVKEGNKTIEEVNRLDFFNGDVILYEQELKDFENEANLMRFSDLRQELRVQEGKLNFKNGKISDFEILSENSVIDKEISQQQAQNIFNKKNKTNQDKKDLSIYFANYFLNSVYDKEGLLHLGYTRFLRYGITPPKLLIVKDNERKNPFFQYNNVVVIGLKQLEEFINSLKTPSFEKFENLINAVAQEEIIHLYAAYLLDYQDIDNIYNEMTEKDINQIKKIYGNSSIQKENIVHEYVRMVVQQRVFGKTTEYETFTLSNAIMSFFGNLLEELNDFLNRIIGSTNTQKAIEDVISFTKGNFSEELDKKIINRVFEKGKILESNLEQLNQKKENLITDSNQAVNQVVKPVVAELFDSNYELANKVYEALGLQGNINLEANLKNTGKTEQELIEYLKQKYPEIKLDISNNPIWEQGDNVFNQEEYINQVNYRLKAVDILFSDKAKQVFEKGKKANWDLNKILTELQIPKEQKQLIADLGITDREQLALELASNYSFIVEINTAKGLGDTFSLNNKYYLESFEDEVSYYADIEGNEVITENVLKYRILNPNGAEAFEFENKIDAEKKLEELNSNLPNSNIYNNLTVPGGTNYTENAIRIPGVVNVISAGGGYHDDQFNQSRGDMAGWFRSDDKVEGGDFKTNMNNPLRGWDTNEGELGFAVTEGGTPTKTRRILEIQSFFQKVRDKKDLVGTNKVTKATGRNGDFNDKVEFIEGDKNQNQFLQLLNKDSNWVTFFIKSIIQDSAKKGYEKVLFPTGNTASKVEGHSTLEEFKKQKEDRIKELEEKNNIIKQEVDEISNSSEDDFIKKNPRLGTYEVLKIKRIRDVDKSPLGIYVQVGLNTKQVAKSVLNEHIKSMLSMYKDASEKNKKEITQLEQELERVETEGFGALKPIYNFYENTVANILKKNFDINQITDEYGNTWNEVIINQTRDLSNVLLQRNEANQIIGQANIKAMTVLVDAVNKKADTIPHEYAHHYIAWFRNTPIVQEAIKRFGSEEALVQAIGEQVVKQKGEAYNWWKKFTNWILNLLSDKQLLQVLTDSFLNRQDLNDFTYKQPNTQQKQQATFMFSEFLDVYLQDYEQVEKILKEENIIQKKCS